MFKKNTQPYTESLGKTNRIVEGTIIKGDIQSVSDFRLDGELIGTFNSKGKLVVGPSGKVLGDIISKNVDIEGLVEGKIVVEELLNLKGTAKVKGDVTCGKLSVDPGADFSATCTMKISSQPIITTQNTNEKREPKPEKQY